MALFAKIAYADGVDTASLLALRFVIAAVLLGGLAFARGASFPQGRVLANYMLMGVAYATMAWAYFSALHYASSATVAMVLYVYPILVAVAAAALRIDHFGLPEGLALAFSSAGLSLVLGGTMQGSSAGFLLALVAALCYSGYIVIGSRNIVAVDAIACSTVRPPPSRSTSSRTLLRISSVSTQVGLIITHVTPWGAPSSATQRVRPSRPDFEAQ